MSLWTVGWLLWILWFVVEEGFALANKQENDTLSEHVWKWASIKNKGNGWRLRRFLLLAGMCWLLVHFMTGGYV